MNGRRLSEKALRRRHIVAAVEGWLGALLGVGAVISALAVVELGCRALGL